MNRNIREDARTRQNDRLIKDTLIDMIKEMDYNQITVTELTKRAGIHRKTFYLHYESIETLFDCLVNDIVEDMKIMMDSLIEENPGINLISLGNNFVKLINSNPVLHKKLFCNDSYGIVYNKIQELSCRHLLAQLKTRIDADPIALENTVYFISYGLNAVTRRNLMEQRLDDNQALNRWAQLMNELFIMGNKDSLL